MPHAGAASTPNDLHVSNSLWVKQPEARVKPVLATI
jgi:hypothetical protein